MIISISIFELALGRSIYGDLPSGPKLDMFHLAETEGPPHYNSTRKERLLKRSITIQHDPADKIELSDHWYERFLGNGY
jgi:hypothetical protein